MKVLVIEWRMAKPSGQSFGAKTHGQKGGQIWSWLDWCEDFAKIVPGYPRWRGKLLSNVQLAFVQIAAVQTDVRHVEEPIEISRQCYADEDQTRDVCKWTAAAAAPSERAILHWKGSILHSSSNVLGWEKWREIKWGKEEEKWKEMKQQRGSKGEERSHVTGQTVRKEKRKRRAKYMYFIHFSHLCRCCSRCFILFPTLPLLTSHSIFHLERHQRAS